MNLWLSCQIIITVHLSAVWVVNYQWLAAYCSSLCRRSQVFTSPQVHWCSKRSVIVNVAVLQITSSECPSWSDWSRWSAGWLRWPASSSRAMEQLEAQGQEQGEEGQEQGVVAMEETAATASLRYCHIPLTDFN